MLLVGNVEVAISWVLGAVLTALDVGVAETAETSVKGVDCVFTVLMIDAEK